MVKDKIRELVWDVIENVFICNVKEFQIFCKGNEKLIKGLNREVIRLEQYFLNVFFNSGVKDGLEEEEIGEREI